MEDKNRQEQIKIILQSYDLGELRSFEKLTNGYSNANYKIEMNTGKNYVYRICQYQTLDEILYEVDLMQKLKQIKFPTAFPLPREDGKYINSLDNQYIVIYEFIQGKQPELNQHTVESIALAIGNLNSFESLVKSSRKNHINLDLCYQLMQKFSRAKYQYLEIFGYFIEQTDYLTKPLAETVPRGMIHGDAFPDNTLFVKNKLIALIDFECACVDNLLYDVGITINGFCFPNNQLDENLLKYFLQSYNQTRKMTDKEINLLPYYMQWGAHGMLSWHLAYDLLNQKNERQLARVEQFMTRVKNLRKNEVLINRIVRESERL